MRMCRKCNQEKMESDFYKDSTNKQGLRTLCKVCDRAQGKSYSDSNKEKESARYKKYAAENSEKIKQRKKYKEILLRKKYRNMQKIIMQKNSEKRLENNKIWYSKNAGSEDLKIRRKAISSKRRCAKINASASWADEQKIREIYAEAHKKTKQTGIEYQVDHIIPLSGKLVCGLHVENNLQVITKKEKLSKGCRFNP